MGQFSWRCSITKHANVKTAKEEGMIERKSSRQEGTSEQETMQQERTPGQLIAKDIFKEAAKEDRW